MIKFSYIHFSLFYAYIFQLTRAQIEALLQGCVVAFDISDSEYVGVLLLDEKTNP